MDINDFVKEYNKLKEENQKLKMCVSEISKNLARYGITITKIGRPYSRKRTEEIEKYLDTHSSFRMRDILKAFGLKYMSGALRKKIASMAEDRGFTEEKRLWTR
jgi:hypothetical protein